MAFSDFKTAAQMRDVIEKIATSVVQRMRPDTRIGEVKSINDTQFTAEVSFAGDEGSINVRYGVNLQPRNPGAIVRVAGVPGNYYITEVLNEEAIVGAYEPVKQAFDDGTIGGSGWVPDGNAPASSPTPTVTSLGFESISIKWDPVANVDPVTYRVYIGTDGATPPADILIETMGTYVATSVLADGVTKLTPGVPYYIQIEAFDEDGVAPKGGIASGSPRLVPPDAVHEDILVANEFYTREAYVGTLSADQIEAGAFRAAYGILGVLSIGATITIDPNSGIVVQGPNGKTQFPTDGSNPVVRGELIADALSVIGQFTMYGSTNEIAKGASLNLETGVTAPKQSPSAQAIYKSHATYKGTNLVGFVGPITMYPGTGTPDRYLTVDSVAGDVVIVSLIKDAGGNYVDAGEKWALHADGGSPNITNGLGGICYIDGYVYILGQDPSDTVSGVGKWKIWKVQHNPAGVGAGRFTYITKYLYDPPVTNTSGVRILGINSGWNPTITNSAGGINITQAASNGVVYRSGYSTVGAYFSSSALKDGGSDFVLKQHIRAFITTAADFGTTKYVLLGENSTVAYVFDVAAPPTRSTVDEWPLISSGGKGLTFDGTRFIQSQGSVGAVYDYSRIKDTNLATSPINVKHDWRNTSSGARSLPSPKQQITIPKRSFLNISVTGSIPDDPTDATDPNAVTFYLARGTGEPINSAYWRLSPDPAAGVKEVQLDILPTSGTNPATTNGFATSTNAPGGIYSSASTADSGGRLIKLLGDGSWRLGRLIGALNGDVSGIGVLPGSSPLAASQPPSQYPLGFSTFYVGSEAGWPTTFATVFTIQHSNSRVIQVIVNKFISGQQADAYMRVADADVWGPWINFAGDTDWISFAPGAGDAPFAGSAVAYAEYRRMGRLVQVRFQKDSTAAIDRSATAGDFADVNVTGTGLPAAVRPIRQVQGSCRMGGNSATAALIPAGNIVWTGGYPRNYASGTTFYADFCYLI